MSKKIVLVTKDSYKYGQTNVIPFAGEVQISEKGEIEVEEEVGKKIVEVEGLGFSFKENQTTTTTTLPQTTTTTTLEEISKKAEVDTLNTEVVDGIENQTTTTTTIIQSLKDLNFNQLRELASSFPEEEWKKFTKKQDLIDYLQSK